MYTLVKTYDQIVCHMSMYVIYRNTKSPSPPKTRVAVETKRKPSKLTTFFQEGTSSVVSGSFEDMYNLGYP